jgi:uncharacterized membrane protein YGL010W
MLAYTQEIVSISEPAPLNDTLKINGSFVLFAVYALYYPTLDFAVGISFDVVLFLNYIGANHLVNSDRNFAWKLAFGMNCFSWYMQLNRKSHFPQQLLLRFLTHQLSLSLSSLPYSWH